MDGGPPRRVQDLGTEMTCGRRMMHLSGRYLAAGTEAPPLRDVLLAPNSLGLQNKTRGGRHRGANRSINWLENAVSLLFVPGNTIGFLGTL